MKDEKGNIEGRVAERLRRKYDHQFHFPFANFISELVYDHVSTLNRIFIKDLLLFTEDREHLKDATHFSEDTLKRSICLKAYEFDSMLSITTEMPLMVLTDTQSIFVRRLKKLHKWITGEESSYSSSSSGTCQPVLHSDKTLVVLKENLSHMTYSQLEEYSELDSLFSRNVGDIFSASSSQSNPQEYLMGQDTVEGSLSSSRRTRPSVKLIRQVEKQLKHLIFDLAEGKVGLERQESRLSRKQGQPASKIESLKEEPKRQPSFLSDSSVASQQEEQLQQGLMLQIQDTLKAQLLRYKLPGKHYSISQQPTSSSLRSRPRKIRDKAELMLKHMTTLDRIL